MKHEKMAAREREAHILAAALVVAERHGYHRFTLQQVADEAEVDKTLPLHYFGTMVALRRDVMRAAIKQGVLAIIAQGITLRDRHAQKAPPELRARALQSFNA
jgi:AcrR family transcriptional regulator